MSVIKQDGSKIIAFISREGYFFKRHAFVHSSGMMINNQQGHREDLEAYGVKKRGKNVKWGPLKAKQAENRACLTLWGPLDPEAWANCPICSSSRRPRQPSKVTIHLFTWIEWSMTSRGQTIKRWSPYTTRFSLSHIEFSSIYCKVKRLLLEIIVRIYQVESTIWKVNMLQSYF